MWWLFRPFFFSFGGQNKWPLVMLHRWSFYTVTIVWEFAWMDSQVVVLQRWWFEQVWLHCENYLQKQLQLLTIFKTRSYYRCFQGSDYASTVCDFEYTGVLDMPTGPILEIGGMNAFSGAHLSKKEDFVGLHPQNKCCF